MSGLHPESAEVQDLVTRAAARLRRVAALRHLDRDDLQQELRVALVRGAPRHDARRGSPLALATTILRSHCATMLRAARRQKRSGAQTSPFDIGHEHMSAAEERRRGRGAQETEERLRCLLEAAARLPEDDRHLLDLLARFSKSRAAAMLGITRAQLDANLRRIRLTLREAI